MDQRFRFSTRRILLITAVLVVWAGVFVNGYRIVPSGNSGPPVFEWAAGVGTFVIPALLLAWLAAVVIRTIGKKSIWLAFCGAAIYVALIALVMWAAWG